VSPWTVSGSMGAGRITGRVSNASSYRAQIAWRRAAFRSMRAIW